jgi:hypothetical protein
MFRVTDNYLTGTSDESKQHSEEVLKSLGGDKAFFGKQEPEKDPTRVAAGLKS